MFRARLTSLIVAPAAINVLTAAWAGDPPPQPPIAGDVKLVATYGGPTTIGPQQGVTVRLKLVNTSKTESHCIVIPGDGSNVGWREPHVFYTGQIRQSDGAWKALATRRLLRCGLFDADWQKDVVQLKPGGELAIDKWLIGPTEQLYYQQAGKTRLFAHYKYSAGRTAKSGELNEQSNTGRMGDAPPFELISNPIELTVERPLDVVVRQRQPLIANLEMRLSDVLEVKLANRTAKPVEAVAPTLHAGSRLQLLLDAEFGWGPTIDRQGAQYGGRFTLSPGESVPLLGPGHTANELDGTWVYPKPGTVRVRAVYMPEVNHRGPQIMSAWADVKVIAPQPSDESAAEGDE
jgi:hypothetical protein